METKIKREKAKRKWKLENPIQTKEIRNKESRVENNEKNKQNEKKKNL